MLSALGVSLLAIAMSGVPAGATNKPPSTTCSEAAFSTFLCYWKNNPTDSKGFSTDSAISDLTTVNFYNDTANVDNDVSVLRTRWATRSVTVFQDKNYNSGTSGGEKCDAVGAPTDKVSADKWPGKTNSMNDSISSHKNVDGVSTC